MQAEVIVLAFPGDVGGRLANINRWADQIGLPGMSDECLNELESIEVDKHAGFIVNLEGVTVRSGTWFLKMMGDSSLVESRKSEFLEFLTSIQFH